MRPLTWQDYTALLVIIGGCLVAVRWLYRERVRELTPKIEDHRDAPAGRWSKNAYLNAVHLTPGIGLAGEPVLRVVINDHLLEADDVERLIADCRSWLTVHAHRDPGGAA